jgi:class I fructose-bisphosphate aldolase
MVIPRVSQVSTKRKSLFLAYDQGLEVGPSVFNLKTVDPKYVLDIALEGHYDGIILEHGIAEKYYHGPYKEIPLIVKLNGKSSLTHISPFATQLCSVHRAVRLGAKAVGYVIYDGSDNEHKMFEQFSKVVAEAHEFGIPVIAWMHPKGKDIDELSSDTIAYSARIGLELGADMINVKYNDDFEGFKWVVKNAGRTKVLVVSPHVDDDSEFLKSVQNIMDTGASGLIVGRTVWQSERPFSLSRALKEMIHEGKSVEEVKQFLNNN